MREPGERVSGALGQKKPGCSPGHFPFRQLADGEDNDIRHFFKHELSALARRRGRTDSWPTSEQLDLLSQRAGGLFIYAAATVNFLDHHIRDPEDQLDAIIRSPKSTVHEGETAWGCTPASTPSTWQPSVKWHSAFFAPFPTLSAIYWFLLHRKSYVSI
jgi:hypothetical protein